MHICMYVYIYIYICMYIYIYIERERDILLPASANKRHTPPQLIFIHIHQLVRMQYTLF